MTCSGERTEGQRVTEAAFAKVNLSLHVTGQRNDGYHLLDSLVAFAEIGDEIHIESSEELILDVTGPMAAGVPSDESNSVLKAARFLSTGRGASIVVTKNLPSAAGIGGGSADAAATLRALSKHWGVPVPGNVLTLGADVPVCLATHPRRLQGIGDQLSSVPSLPETWIVLVNSGSRVATPEVFKALRNKFNPAMPKRIPAFETTGDLVRWLSEQRNDLERPAIGLAPDIRDVLNALSGAALARMSGSGATCFGLFEQARDARRSAARIQLEYPGWWVSCCRLLRA